MSNAIELILLVGALIFSRAKAVPCFLITYNLFIQYVTFINVNKLTAISQKVDAGTLNLYLEDMAMISNYTFEGFYMLMFAVCALFLVTRLSYFMAVLIILQAFASFIAGIAVYLIHTQGYDLYSLFDAHSQVNDKFVILYVIAAWISVYLSRKTKI